MKPACSLPLLVLMHQLAVSQSFSSLIKHDQLLLHRVQLQSFPDSPVKVRRTQRSRTKRGLLVLHSESSKNGPETLDLTGKTVYQRVFYQLSSDSDVPLYNSMVVEERVRFQATGANDDTIQPIGPRTLILRDGQVDEEEGEIGNEFLEFNVVDGMSRHDGAGVNFSTESAIATALYIAGSAETLFDPKAGNALVADDLQFRGTRSSADSGSGKRMLEVACNLGLASILGVAGAGFASRNRDKDEPRDIADDLLTIPTSHDNKFPAGLEFLCLTDTDETNLDFAFQNAKHAGMVNGVGRGAGIEILEWNRRPLRSVRQIKPQVSQEYRVIVASDIAFTYPEAKELARCVASRLEPSYRYLTAVDRGYDDKPILPTFVHVCRDVRDDAVYLQRILEKGYKMDVRTGYITLEKLLFHYQTLDSSAPESELDEIALELQDVKETTFQVLCATHHPDYAGEGSGEMFFPMETGEYESGGSSGGFGSSLEREWETR
jgi:hypothetical protein